MKTYLNRHFATLRNLHAPYLHTGSRWARHSGESPAEWKSALREDPTKQSHVLLTDVSSARREVLDELEAEGGQAP